MCDARAASSVKSILQISTSYFGLGTEADDVKELAVGPGVDVYSLAAVLEGVLDDHGEEDTEERQYKDAALFYPPQERPQRWRS